MAYGGALRAAGEGGHPPEAVGRDVNLGLSDLHKLKQNTAFHWAALVTMFQRCPGQGHGKEN